MIGLMVGWSLLLSDYPDRAISPANADVNTVTSGTLLVQTAYASHYIRVSRMFPNLFVSKRVLSVG